MPTYLFISTTNIEEFLIYIYLTRIILKTAVDGDGQWKDEGIFRSLNVRIFMIVF